jgi:nitrite reductase [NAD(P)H] small subunit
MNAVHLSSQMPDEAWIRVGRLEDIPSLGARVVRIEGESIAVFRTADDEVYALTDRCPHRGGPLSQGIVFGTRVACPLHDWVIELKTGIAVAPDVGCTATHRVRIENGIVWLVVTSPTDAYALAESRYAMSGNIDKA